MSATSSTSDSLVYASKEDLLNAEQGIETPKLAEKIKGRAGWRRGVGGTIDGFVFVMTPGSSVYDWIANEVHTRNVHNLRRQNYEHFKLNPTLLYQKIRLKKKGPDIFSHR
ncbi:MAG: hypothetical protein V4481_01980 [Patescibacteria group bacterium]